MVYDRHNVYKKLDDYSVYLKVNNALAIDKTFKNKYCVIDITVFNGDILLAGHVPSPEMNAKLHQRLGKIKGYRRLFNQVRLNRSTTNAVQDSWITAKIRSQIFADDSIDPSAFKITTTDKIVYLMGDVHEEQALKVINIARHTAGVVRVVKIFKYYTYERSA